MLNKWWNDTKGGPDTAGQQPVMKRPAAVKFEVNRQQGATIMHLADLNNILTNMIK
jgi:hypothetical protein